jgi:beta-galactosidase
MPRPLRVEYAGGIYHVMNRGNRRERIFRAPRDYQLMLKTLDEEEPILNDLNPRGAGPLCRKPGQTLDLGTVPPVLEGMFSPVAQWQTASFPSPVQGRYVCLEAVNSHSGPANAEFTTCAELGLLGVGGVELDRGDWKVLYADSEEVLAENGGAENVLDADPATFWHTEWDRTKAPLPHHLVIDLGREREVAGLRYLPRANSENGRIKNYRIHLSDAPFAGLETR